MTYFYQRNCHKAKYVRVGNSRVYICGDYDLTDKSFMEIKKLDIFIGLDRSWEEYLPRIYKSEYCQIFSKFIGSLNDIDNLFVFHIKDGKTNYHLSRAIIAKLKLGWKIGFGCIGGHGRTGWMLATLIREMERLEGEELLDEVRLRLCEEAIESKEQFESLGLGQFYQPPKYVGYGWVYDATLGRLVPKEEKSKTKGGETDAGKEVTVPIIE